MFKTRRIAHELSDSESDSENSVSTEEISEIINAKPAITKQVLNKPIIPTKKVVFKNVDSNVDRNEFLSSIRRGKELKKVETREQPIQLPASPMIDGIKSLIENNITFNYVPETSNDVDIEDQDWDWSFFTSTTHILCYMYIVSRIMMGCTIQLV